MRLTRAEIREREERARERVTSWVGNFPLNHRVDDRIINMSDRIGRSLRSFSDDNLRVTLVTYGWRETYGLDYLRSILGPEDVGVRKIIQCSHGIDCIFDHRDRLSTRGRRCSAQAEFIDIYTSESASALGVGAEVFCQLFRKMIYMIEDSITENLSDVSVLHLLCCRHGHHRSQAFCELLAKILRWHWPFLRVDIWHLDEERESRWRPRAVLNELDFETHFKVPLLKALSPLDIHSSRYLYEYFRFLQFRRPRGRSVTMARELSVGGTVEEERT